MRSKRNINYQKKICQLCKKTFLPTSGKQIYCGSRRKKIGCSYERKLSYNYKFNYSNNKKLALNYKRLFLEHYGGRPPQCARCRVKIIAVLSIDHISGHGANQRKEFFKKRKTNWHGAGTQFYRWLIKNHYPSGYQVLCRNCNWLKYLETKEQKQIRRL